MKKKHDLHVDDDHKRSSFWFGFALGATTVSSAIFFLGTKRGRTTLKRIIELSEGLEETIFEVLKDFGVEALHEIKDNLSPKVARTFTALKDSA